MTKQEKDRITKMLMEKKKGLASQLSEIYNESKKTETPIAQDPGDRAESSYTKEFLLNLSDQERAILILIDDALKRIDEPDFGKCKRCGKKIGKKRLNVIPWAPHCIECQVEEEESSV